MSIVKQITKGRQIAGKSSSLTRVLVEDRPCFFLLFPIILFVCCHSILLLLPFLLHHNLNCVSLPCFIFYQTIVGASCTFLILQGIDLQIKGYPPSFIQLSIFHDLLFAFVFLEFNQNEIQINTLKIISNTRMDITIKIELNSKCSKPYVSKMK